MGHPSFAYILKQCLRYAPRCDQQPHSFQAPHTSGAFTRFLAALHAARPLFIISSFICFFFCKCFFVIFHRFYSIININWFFLTSRSLCICLCQKTVVCIVHSCFKRMPNTNKRVYWFCTIFFEFVVFVSNLLKEVVGNDDNVSVKVNRYTLLSILLNNKKCAFLA